MSTRKTIYYVAINKYMAANVPPINYVNMIKLECSSCGAPLTGTLKHYEEYGNYCIPCDYASEREAKKHSLTEGYLDMIFRSRFPNEHIDEIVQKVKENSHDENRTLQTT